MPARASVPVVYVLALLGGSACSMLISSPLAFGVGASGAIFGVLGGLIVVFRRYRFDLRQLVLVLAINIYASFQISGVSWQDHLGGLVVGELIRLIGGNPLAIELVVGLTGALPSVVDYGISLHPYCRSTYRDVQVQ